jgi:hypothetical protein
MKMTRTDKLARRLREAFAEHEGDADTLVPWSRADTKKKDAWRAIAKAAEAELAR